MGKTADIIITKIGLFANLIIERLTEPLTILVVHLKIHSTCYFYNFKCVLTHMRLYDKIKM